MEETIEIVGFRKIRCLHCGTLVDLDKEIHFCKSEKNAWLNKTKKAFMEMPDGNIWDLKNKCIIKNGRNKI